MVVIIGSNWVLSRVTMGAVQAEDTGHRAGKATVKQVKQGNFTALELEVLNTKLNNLEAQVRALDGESRRTEDGKILE